MLPKFELYMPDTMEEACRLKAEGAEVVAGGTDVFVNMHGGKDRSGKVVDIKNIPTLQGHTFDEAQGLDLGALTTHREIELWDVIKKHYRAMFEGCSRVGLCPDPHPGDAGGQHLQRRALGGQHRPHAGPRCPGSGCWPCWRAGDPPPQFLPGLEKAGFEAG